MFGVVPKALWARRAPPDDRNRIPLALRCLLVEHDDGLVLIDTGIGNKEDEKFIDIYGVENKGANGRTKLEDAIAELGHTPNDIRWGINTHLHFDDAGGNKTVDGLAFPKARYVVQKADLTAGRGRELVDDFRARCARRERAARQRRKGRRACGGYGAPLICRPQYGKRARRAPHPLPLRWRVRQGSSRPHRWVRNCGSWGNPGPRFLRRHQERNTCLFPTTTAKHRARASTGRFASV